MMAGSRNEEEEMHGEFGQATPAGSGGYRPDDARKRGGTGTPEQQAVAAGKWSASREFRRFGTMTPTHARPRTAPTCWNRCRHVMVGDAGERTRPRM